MAFVKKFRNLASIFLLHLLRFFATEAVAIDNGVLGEPTISCGANDVRFFVNTQKPFEGKIFVKGEYGKIECTATKNSSPNGHNESVWSVTPATINTSDITAGANTASTSRTGHCPPCPICETLAQRGAQLRAKSEEQEQQNTASLTVRIGDCNMKRERSLNPIGVTLTMTVVVSFHQQFITKVDKAYQVRCFYMESEKTVTSILDVSMPQTTELIAQVAMPVCTYTIRRSSPDGPEVQYAKVGEPVFHRWECASGTPGVFGMLVHSCYVDDGGGHRVEVINKTGCSLDRFVLNDLNYESSLYAYVESHVFKFADRAVLDFQCAINICVKDQNGCSGITPPTCSRRRAKRENHVKDMNDYSVHPPASRWVRDRDWDLHAPRVTVIDLDDNIPSEDLQKLEKSISESLSVDQSLQRRKVVFDELETTVSPISKTNFCLSITGFGVLVSTCTFLLTGSSAVLATLYIMKRKY